MDEADLTDKLMERELAALLRLRRQGGPAPSGHCLWCGEPLPSGRRWCNADCRDAWEREHAHPHRG